MILVPKKDDTWRMCTNCMPINNITIRYRHLIPCLDDLLLIAWFSNGDECKTIFKTKFGLYEWLIMHCGLTNVPSTFVRLMNHVLRSLIGKSVLEILRKETLFANLEKCIFCTNKVVFLGFVVGSHGVKVNREKVKAIKEQPMPKIVGEVRSFHGLACFYKTSIKDFQRLTQAPILALGNFLKSFELEHGASWVGIEAMLLQEGYPIAYFSELNVVANVLSRRHTLIAMLETKMIGLDWIKELYEKDIDFSKPFAMYVHVAFREEIVCANKLNQPIVLKEAHESDLMGYFGELKTYDVLNEREISPPKKI
ncbi:Retrovirus-related Pol polyprotein from transposon 17.6, partial [Mucuna pruriens]